MKFLKCISYISALLLIFGLVSCARNAEDSTQTESESVTEEESTEKEDIKVEYKSDKIVIQSKSDSSFEISLDDANTSMMISLLNESDRWTPSTSHASYNYVFELSDEVSVEYCSVHGIFKDRRVGKELKLSDAEIKEIKKSIPIDPIKCNYSDVENKISVGQSYYNILKVIGENGIAVDSDEMTYRWVFSDGIVMTVYFIEPDLSAFDMPDDLIAAEIVTEKIFE